VYRSTPATSVVLLPDDMPDEIGAQMLVNIATAQTVIRAAYDSLPTDARNDVVTLVTAAGSAAHYPATRIADAVAHVGRPGRVGAVLLHFPTQEGAML